MASRRSHAASLLLKFFLRMTIPSAFLWTTTSGTTRCHHGWSAIHSYEVQKIEVPDNDLPSTSNGVGSQNQLGIDSSYPLAKLLKGVEKSYDKGKKCLKRAKTFCCLSIYEKNNNSRTDVTSRQEQSSPISIRLGVIWCKCRQFFWDGKGFGRESWWWWKSLRWYHPLFYELRQVEQLDVIMAEAQSILLRYKK